MCNQNQNHNQCCCNEGIKEILETIAVLQRSAVVTEENQSCDKNFLSCGSNNNYCNTRPISLYTCNNDLCTFPIFKNSLGIDPCELSTVFRVEKIDDCCVTCRVLKEAPESSVCNKLKFVATDCFFTMNINCICAIRCFSDTFVDVC